MICKTCLLVYISGYKICDNTVYNKEFNGK
jgi:hypothetical protein